MIAIKKQAVTVLTAGLCLLWSSVFCGCATVGPDDERRAETRAEQSARMQEKEAERTAESDAERAAELEAEKDSGMISEENTSPGGWMEQKADNPDIRAAYDFFSRWIVENWNLIDTGSLPESWRAHGPDSGLTAELNGGGTQVVSGLNLRLDLEAEDLPEMVTVYLYRDFSKKHEVSRIEISGRTVYSAP